MTALPTETKQTLASCTMCGDWRTARVGDPCVYCVGGVFGPLRVCINSSPHCVGGPVVERVACSLCGIKVTGDTFLVRRTCSARVLGGHLFVCADGDSPNHKTACGGSLSTVVPNGHPVLIDERLFEPLDAPPDRPPCSGPAYDRRVASVWSVRCVQCDGIFIPSLYVSRQCSAGGPEGNLHVFVCNDDSTLKGARVDLREELYAMHEGRPPPPSTAQLARAVRDLKSGELSEAGARILAANWVRAGAAQGAAELLAAIPPPDPAIEAEQRATDAAPGVCVEAHLLSVERDDLLKILAENKRLRERVVELIANGTRLRDQAITARRVGTAEDARDRRQIAVMTWVQRCFGVRSWTIPERALRFVEEAIELAQAAGLAKERIAGLLEYVYRRPVGTIVGELGGVAVTMLAFAQAAGLSADFAETEEIERVLALPEKFFADRYEKKIVAGVTTLGKD